MTPNQHKTLLQNAANELRGSMDAAEYKHVVLGLIFLKYISDAFHELHIRRIARILGTLDDKIELNRRISHTLEQLARTLYHSWFIDFEPVQAKQQRWQPNQSLPALPAHIYHLFPDHLQTTPPRPHPRQLAPQTAGRDRDIPERTCPPEVPRTGVGEHPCDQDRAAPRGTLRQSRSGQPRHLVQISRP